MKNHSFIALAIIAIVLLTTNQSQARNRYSTQCWDPSFLGSGSAPYSEDQIRDSTFYVTSGVLVAGEPGLGYPMRSGQEIGVSDTAEIHISLINATYNTIFLGGAQPTTWLTPVLYELNANPHVVYPIAQYPELNWRFIQWLNPKGQIVSPPTSIGSHTGYKMIFYVWGFPDGRGRLLVKKTGSAPSNLQIIIGYGGDIWVTKPKFQADTLNAYASCYWMANDRQANLSDRLLWINSILSCNPQSLVGYWLKAHLYSTLFDSLGIIAATDSALAIAYRYGDPIVSDTTKFTEWHRLWYRTLIEDNAYRHKKLTSGNWWRIEQ
jgi:hypothetical protein